MAFAAVRYDVGLNHVAFCVARWVLQSPGNGAALLQKKAAGTLTREYYSLICPESQTPEIVSSASNEPH